MRDRLRVLLRARYLVEVDHGVIRRSKNNVAILLFGEVGVLQGLQSSGRVGSKGLDVQKPYWQSSEIFVSD